MDPGIGPVFWTPHRIRVVLALASLYLLWGSTFLGIRVAVETLPPLLMAALRWLLAGGLLLAWSIYREGLPRRARVLAFLRGPELARAAVAGALLVVVGNGGVTWAETRVPSGVAALVNATVSLWMVLLSWARPGGTRPTARVLLGVALGIAGVALLGSGGGGRIDGPGLLVLLCSALGWSLGSLWLRGMAPPAAPLRGMALQMLVGGGLLLVLGLLRGEAAALHVQGRGSGVSLRSVLGLGYLAVAGSLAGYTIYQWLLRAAAPAVVSTYACVNPVVAVALGWLLAGEAYGGRMLATAGLIITSVALVIAPRQPLLPRWVTRVFPPRALRGGSGRQALAWTRLRDARGSAGAAPPRP